MNKVGLVVNSNKEGANELNSKIMEWLKKRDVSVASTVFQSTEEVLLDASIVVCLGGDGTILSLVRKMKGASTPVLGVNLGRLGFLTEVKESEIFEALSECVAGKIETESRMMLAGHAYSEKHKIRRRYIALNDIVISREGLTRILPLEVLISGEKLTSFRGDGVIVSSPTGSTAYSLSAGGAVIDPQLSVFMITPICPHASSLRPMVISAEEKVTIRVQTAPGEKALLTADGQENLEIDDSFSVEITRFEAPLNLIKSPKRSYLENLRENFKFPDS